MKHAISKCPVCGEEAHVAVGDEGVRIYAVASTCLRCGTMISHDLASFVHLAKDVADRILTANNPFELAKEILTQAQKLKTGKDLAAARSDGSLAGLKKYRLIPRNKKEWAVVVGIAMAVVKWYSQRPAEDKGAHPTQQTIVNVYINGVDQKLLAAPATQPGHP